MGATARYPSIASIRGVSLTYEQYCHPCRIKFDFLAPRFTTPDPECPRCGGPTERQISAPAIVFAKPLSAYGDPSKETFAKDQKAGGHWVFERDSDRAQEAGKPIPRFIETRQQQADYCKSEGLVNPSDLPSSLNVTADGMGYQTANLSEV